MSLRPVGQHAAMRRAAARHGARVVALSPWRITPCDDPTTRAALSMALRADRIVFTSPAAVGAAAALQPLQPGAPGQRWLAVGSGTAAALRKAGVQDVLWPERMDSEGLLALPTLQSIRGLQAALVTAPGGRGEIARVLQERGAHLLRADVYRREQGALATRGLAALQRLDPGFWLALSSAEALQRVLEHLPDAARRKLLRAHVVAASQRLASLALASGFSGVLVVARSARPRDLLDAAADARPSNERAASQPAAP